MGFKVKKGTGIRPYDVVDTASGRVVDTASTKQDADSAARARAEHAKREAMAAKIKR